VIGLTKSDLDKKIHNLILEKRELYIKEDNNQISRDDMENKIRFINEELKKLNNIKINKINQDIKEQEQNVKSEQKRIIEKLKNLKKQPVVKQPVVKQPVKKQPVVKQLVVKQSVVKESVIQNHNNKKRKESKCSYAKLIIKALSNKAVDTENKLIAIVTHWRPGIHRNDLKLYIRNIISEVRRGKRPGLSWDDENFSIIKNI